MHTAIIFDTEFTSWEGAMARNWSGPGEYRELVQIGAVKIETAGFTVIETLDLLVKPVRNPVLSDYFINLTGIQQAQLDRDGVSLPDAIKRFEAFTQGLTPWSYGGDIEILAENLQLQGLPVPAHWPGAGQSNLRPWFHQHAPQTRGINSGRLASVLGIANVAAEHTGLGDSLSITAALRHLVLEQGIASPF